MSEPDKYLYTKDMSEPLNFMECEQLLSKLIEEKYILKDPNNENNMLVYRKAGTTYPEGWYSENILSTASDLVNDLQGQKILRETLAKNGIEMQFRDCMGAAKDFLEPIIERQEKIKNKNNDNMER